MAHDDILYDFTPDFCIVCCAGNQVRDPSDTSSTTNHAGLAAISRLRPRYENPRYKPENGTMCGVHHMMHTVWQRDTGRLEWKATDGEENFGRERMRAILEENRKHYEELIRAKGNCGAAQGCCAVC